MKIENTNYIDYLIELSKSGRKRAFFDLCGLNLRNVFTVAYRLVTDLETTKKITLKIFFWAWDNIKEYNPSIPFAIWIKNATIRFSVMELKRTSVERKIHQEKNKYKTEIEYIESLIMSLATEERIIFVLHDIEGYSYQQIHEFLNELEIDELKTKLINTREYLMSVINL